MSVPNNQLHRQDIPQASRLTVTERLEEGFTKLFSDLLINPRGMGPFGSLLKFMKPKDPTKGFGFEIVGYNFPKMEMPVKIGEHFIARYHDYVPINKATFNNKWAVRSTITYSKDYMESISNPVDFWTKNMASFAQTMLWFKEFLMYMLFRNLSGQADRNEESVYCESTKVPEYETFIAEIYKPANSQPIPFYSESLSLEAVTKIDSREPNTTHNLDDHITSIRQRLKTNIETYTPAQSLKPFELHDDTLASFALLQKIRRIATAIKRNCGQYNITKEAIKNIALGNITSEDLIAVINDEEELNIVDGYSKQLESSKGDDFSPASLGVGEVIKTHWVAPGEAYVFHKQALQFLITEQEVFSNEYPEHRCTNYITRMSFIIDVIDLFPFVVIKRQGP